MHINERTKELLFKIVLTGPPGTALKAILDVAGQSIPSDNQDRVVQPIMDNINLDCLALTLPGAIREHKILLEIVTLDMSLPHKMQEVILRNCDGLIFVVGDTTLKLVAEAHQLLKRRIQAVLVESPPWIYLLDRPTLAREAPAFEMLQTSLSPDGSDFLLAHSTQAGMEGAALKDILRDAVKRGLKDLQQSS